ncbi:MAG: hypothetical protein JWQ44_1174 [Chthoniobacter sp.]|nr:hypothetical protein [Chthoniobacter sp.]
MRRPGITLLLGGGLIIAIATWITWDGRRSEAVPPPPAFPEEPASATAQTNHRATSPPVKSAPHSLPTSPAFQPPGTPLPLPAPAVLRPPPAPPPVTEEVAADLDEVRITFRDFRSALGENPVGTNAEITSALLGQNPRQLKLGVPPGSALNGSGELTDRWGTPYFFHQLSRTDMEIRSAGPDRTMWTGDDRLAR